MVMRLSWGTWSPAVEQRIVAHMRDLRTFAEMIASDSRRPGVMPPLQISYPRRNLLHVSNDAQVMALAVWLEKRRNIGFLEEANSPATYLVDSCIADTLSPCAWRSHLLQGPACCLQPPSPSWCQNRRIPSTSSFVVPDHFQSTENALAWDTATNTPLTNRSSGPRHILIKSTLNLDPRAPANPL